MQEQKCYVYYLDWCRRNDKVINDYTNFEEFLRLIKGL